MHKGGGAVFSVFAIIFLGILILMNKVSWATILVVVGGMGIFYGAHNIPQYFTTNEINVNAKCKCETSLDDIIDIIDGG